MVSPKARRTPRARRTDSIDESNTTASLFLGGVRRDWMGPVENSRPRNSSHVEMPPDKDSSDSRVLLSPVTPGETLQPIARGDAAPVKTPDPQGTIQETALPSPALSTNSRPSPVRADPVASSSRVLSGLTQPVRGDDETIVVQPLPGPVAQHSNGSLARVQSQTDLHSRPPEYTFSVPGFIQRHNGGPAPGPIIPSEMWDGWRLQLKSMEEEWASNGLMQASECGGKSVLRPRLSLLEQALARKDPFYLVVHQLFCQHTIDASILGRIRAPVDGIRVLNLLLEVNTKMHYSATFRLAHFPYSPQQLSQQAWYLHELQTVPVFFARIAHGWIKLWKHAQHPPLVSVLSERFALPSPIMMLVMFLCVARRLHGEQYIHRLEILFWKDWESTNGRASDDPNTTTSQARYRNFMREYLTYPRLPTSSSPQTHSPDSENTPPIETMSPAQETSSNYSTSPVNGVPQSAIPSHTRSTPGQTLVSNKAPARYSEPVSRSASWNQRYSGGGPSIKGSPCHGQMPQGQTLVHVQGQRFNNQISHQAQSYQRQSSHIQSPQTQSPQRQSPLAQRPQVQNSQLQRPRVQTPQPHNPQSQSHQMQSPLMQMGMQMGMQMERQMHMQARRHGQVPPDLAYQFTQRQNSQSQRGANGSHRFHDPLNSATAANSPIYPSQLVAFTSNAPHPPNAQSAMPIPTSANYLTQLLNAQVVSQSPHIQTHHHPASSQIFPPLTQAPRGIDQAQASDPPGQHHQPMPFYAGAGYKAPITLNGDPLRLGLHLVHLRDPMKKLVKLGPDGEAIDTELYSYFNAFIVKPTLIDANESNYTWPIKLAQKDLQRFPRITPGTDGYNSVWTYQAGYCTIRLRCIRLDGKPGSFTEKDWAISSTHWPSVFYVTVNGKDRQVRRKAHNSKDLPLDITEFLNAGDNSIRIDLLLGKDECKSCEYYFGVEIMEVAAFEDVLRLVQPIPAADSRAAIQRRLAPTANDDDLAVVTDNLTINLIDPFMARIFDVPARSKNCNHAECFDCDTFIRTRKSVSGQTPMVDNWRCPVCKADARPKFLVVDYFLAEIHAELARSNRLAGAEAVQIKADGTWALRANTKTDETSAQTRRDSTSTGQKRKIDGSRSPSEPTSTRPRLEHESHQVIELD
jgi:hypothetical protein